MNKCNCILKNVGSQATLDPADCHYMNRKHWFISQNLFLCVSHRSEWEEMMTERWMICSSHQWESDHLNKLPWCLPAFTTGILIFEFHEIKPTEINEVNSDATLDPIKSSEGRPGVSLLGIVGYRSSYWWKGHAFP